MSTTYHTIRLTNKALTRLLHLPEGAQVELAGPGDEWHTSQFMISIEGGGPDAIELTPVYKQDVDAKGCKSLSFKEWGHL